MGMGESNRLVQIVTYHKRKVQEALIPIPVMMRPALRPAKQVRRDRNIMCFSSAGDGSGVMCVFDPVGLPLGTEHGDRNAERLFKRVRLALQIQRFGR